MHFSKQSTVAEGESVPAPIPVPQYFVCLLFIGRDGSEILAPRAPTFAQSETSGLYATWRTLVGGLVSWFHLIAFH